MLGLGIIMCLHALDVQRGLWTIVAAHMLMILPVVTFIVMVRLEGLDANFERAAMDLGATPWQAFLYVSVPQALPGIVSAALIGFALSMDEFIVTFLVTGQSVTLPLFIYSSLRFQQTPELTALSAMMLASSLVLGAAGALILRTSDTVTRRRRRATAAAAAEA
jgi:ABC-type spermidine/putrescine transport system permease subunit II